MKADFVLEGRKLTVTLFGELDHHSAGEIMKEINVKIDDELPRDCILDMHGVTFMDSSGIAVAIRTYRKMNLTGGRMWIENVQSQPMHIFDAAVVDRIIHITATV